jgi:winged helix-turn-helix DNA-binding protein
MVGISDDLQCPSSGLVLAALGAGPGGASSEAEEGTMDGWWDDMDREILEALTAAKGPTDPVDLARALGIPPAALCSCLAMLVADGKVRICSVESTSARLARVA